MGRVFWLVRFLSWMWLKEKKKDERGGHGRVFVGFPSLQGCGVLRSASLRPFFSAVGLDG